MAPRAFQKNAFQNNAFQVGAGIDITDTTYLTLPINGVLIGDQPYEKVGREYDIRAANPRRKITGRVSAVAQLSNSAASFEVKSTSRGYV